MDTALLDIRHGKIARFKYIIWLSLVQIIYTAVVLTIGTHADLTQYTSGQGLTEPLIKLPGYFIIIHIICIYLCTLLDTRRLRDIGATPWFAILGFLLYSQMAVMISAPPMAFLELMHKSPWVGYALNIYNVIGLIYLIFLVFSKSNSEEESKR